MLSRGEGRSALVVDDDEDFRALLVELLKNNADCTVEEAADRHGAVISVRYLQPEWILVDLMMPGMEGWEALPLLREAAPDAVIVVFTAYPDILSLTHALELGADSVLSKESVWAELVPVLDELSWRKTIDQADYGAPVIQR